MKGGTLALLGSSLGRSSRGRMFLVRAACVIPAPTMPRERTWSRASCMSTGVLSPASSASLLRLLLLFSSPASLCPPPPSLLASAILQAYLACSLAVVPIFMFPAAA